MISFLVLETYLALKLRSFYLHKRSLALFFCLFVCLVGWFWNNLYKIVYT